MRFISRIFPLVLCMIMLLGAVPYSAAALEQDGFVYEINEDNTTIVITGYNGDETVVEIPSEIDGMTVTAIGESAFEAHTAITAVSVPSSVNVIGDTAFYNCTSLATISLSPYTYDIGYQAFHNTAWFMDAEEGPLYIGRVFYSYVGALEEGSTITIDYGTAAVVPYALSGRKKLQAIYLPVGLKKIGNCAFFNCNSLTEVRIPPSVTEIGNDVFLRAESATILCVNDSVAYDYAVDHSLYFKHDETLDYLDGDMDKNGTVNSSDFRLLMRVLLDENTTYDVERYWSCDAVYDGTIDSADLRSLMRMAIGL